MPEEATPSAPQPSTSAQVSQNTCTVLTLLAVYHRRHANSGLKDIGASDGVTCSSSVCNLLPCLAVKSVPPHPRGGAEAQQLTPTHGCTTGGGPGEGGGSCSGAHGGYTDSTAAVHQRSGMQPEPCAALGCLRQLVCGPVVPGCHSTTTRRSPCRGLLSSPVHAVVMYAPTQPRIALQRCESCES